jgi:hypothetical protein
MYLFGLAKLVSITQLEVIDALVTVCTSAKFGVTSKQLLSNILILLLETLAVLLFFLVV